MTNRRFHLFILVVVFLVGFTIVTPTTTSLSPEKASAQQGTICGNGLWDTQYYPNTTATPTGVDQTICITGSQLTSGINWGTGSPLVGVIGTDFWSASFQAQVTLGNPGTYTFTSAYQDGIRLFVNGQLIVNTFLADVATVQNSTGTFTSTAVNQVVTVRLEFVNFSGSAQVSLNWSLSGGGTQPVGQPWTAQYFNNRTFTGTPITGPTIPAGPLSIDWQFSVPAAGVNADGWSSRFTRVVNFPTGGVVNFEARADDTVTVYVNGGVVLASAPFFAGEGVIYRGSISVPAGNSTIVVDHTDIVDQAYIFVNWSGGGDTSGGGTPGTDPTNPIVVSPTGVVATVNTSVLNFRSAPTTSAQRITQINRGEQYAVLGQNVGGDWAYLQVDGTRGWSFAQFLSFSGDFASVPILGADGQPITIDDSGNVVLEARPVGNMRIRECPNFSCARLGFVPWGDVVSVFGQSFDGRWIRIAYTGSAGTIVGWTSKIWFRPANDLDSPLPANLPIVE